MFFRSQRRLKTKSLIVVAVIAAFVKYSVAFAESRPSEISAWIGEIKKDCELGGGQFNLKDALDHGVLGRAHREVWVLDYSKFNCINNQCFWGGCTGPGLMNVVVFLRLPNRRVEKVFDDYILGSTLEHSGRSPKLLLKVLGEDCGQTGDFEPFEAIQCIRPLAWNEKTQELEFAPLSDTKITSMPNKQ